jgi:DNA-binding NtrC family response regulator
MGSAKPHLPIVLVVEDEPILRMHAVAVVEDARFEAIEASNADEAIAILESRNDIRIVFTDVDMPGSMDGLRLAAAVRGRWPPIEFIVTSGHVNVRTEDMPVRGVFLPKPYDPHKVAKTLQGFLQPRWPPRVWRGRLCRLAPIG